MRLLVAAALSLLPLGAACGSSASCPTGRARCGGACVETATDPEHCGGCGVACAAAEVCSAGACRDGCPSGREACDGACVDTTDDPRHCGGCGASCAEEERCRGGTCVVEVPPGGRRCDWPIELVDTATADHVVGDGTPESCTAPALAAAVAAGGVIAFACGEGEVVIEVTETLEPPIDVDTVLDGGGSVVLDGGGVARILELRSPDFRATDTRLVLQRLELRGGRAPATDFTPPDPDDERCAWGYRDGQGGAVFVRDARLHVIECRFRGNRAAESGPDTGGGAIYAVGAREVVVVGSTFIDNEGSNGGAVYLLQSDGVFHDTVFEANRATGEGQNFGGATGCPDFNHAAQGGAGGNAGALGVDGGSVERLEICGVDFRFNHANELGTVFRTPNSQRGATTIDRTLFHRNHAGAGGGAVWMQDMELVLTATAVVENTSDGLGAGIRVDQGGHGSTVLIENVTFQGNVATRSLGGGLVFSGEGLVRNCTFAENEAAGGEGFFGAAIVAHGEAATGLRVQNTIFWNNVDDHEWTPMTCSVGSPGRPVPLPGAGNVQWPRLRNGPSGQEDNPCTADVVWADAELGPLSDHGGPTPTMEPSPASPARGLGRDCPATDQRGEPRSTATCTAGALE